MSIDQIGTPVQPVVAQIDAVAARAAQAERPAQSGETSRVQAEAKAPREQVSDEQLNQAVSTTNKFLQVLSQNLQFSIDRDTHKTIVKLVDSSTREVLRQIPSEEMLAIAKALDKLQGLLIKEQA